MPRSTSPPEGRRTCAAPPAPCSARPLAQPPPPHFLTPSPPPPPPAAGVPAGTGEDPRPARVPGGLGEPARDAAGAPPRGAISPPPRCAFARWANGRGVTAARFSGASGRAAGRRAAAEDRERAQRGDPRGAEPEHRRASGRRARVRPRVAVVSARARFRPDAASCVRGGGAVLSRLRGETAYASEDDAVGGEGARRQGAHLQRSPLPLRVSASSGSTRWRRHQRWRCEKQCFRAL